MALQTGDAAPAFKARTPSNPTYAFDTAAGRYLLLGFFPSQDGPLAAAMGRAVGAARRLFDDDKIAFFGVLRGVEACARAQDSFPGVRWFLDADRAVSRLYGMDLAEDREACGWILLDPAMRVLATAPVEATDQLFADLQGLPPVDDHAGVALHAPVLIVPRVFEPAFCARLIEAYHAGGGAPSGFMRDVDGRTVEVHDPSHKRRSDHVIEDEALREQIRVRVIRRLTPQIARAFAFTPTRMERYLVARYDALDAGFFRAHRDNTTKGTAHRRFAVTINLNAEAYDGGDLAFPEYGSRTYRAPTGGAVVFSCSLLHEARPVTRGERYAFLPFLYDEAAAQLREANTPFVSAELAGYRAGPAPGATVADAGQDEG
ncbi:2OG-Fe(II) oxygenase [Caulobacter sp. UNC279MFTsu5.1]|uniref:2OG-Fe(II) oxygenase n=1 Tax=Caulobacter sp. UNC279MFTsu5.1 TaxID=1502775 RepID=UPI0008F132F3|nr:2OG-Fe(II) oxygenase [Caulobacter sp. UNC279MFTsu5.1]SFI60244.1 Predicted 2-oxoglutarate-and Fe(II)-dependent dioxygenase YbiX [Caulobacter sp. UNC279MFTsu5.1]